MNAAEARADIERYAAADADAARRDIRRRDNSAPKA